MKILFSCIILFGIIGNVCINGVQYLTDRDRKELNDLRNIQPAAGSKELKLIESFPSADEETAGKYFAAAISLEIDKDGNYYIADQRENVIYKYNSSGNYIATFGRPGQGPGDLSLPQKVRIRKKDIVVSEAGNMRLQFLNNSGEYKNIVRLFKTYMDLEISENGDIVGASFAVGSQKNDMLIDILSPDGTMIRSFGKPSEFKYDGYILNTRKIFVNSKSEIIVVYKYLDLIQRFSMKGELIQERELSTRFSSIKEGFNRRMNSYRPNERVGYSGNIMAAAINDEHLFLIDFVPSRIWIWEVDEKLKIIGEYWANVGESMMVRDIYAKKKGEEIYFYILGDIGENPTKVHVFVKK